MMSTYDAELSLALGRQRAAELRAEVERDRLARALRDGGPPPSRWWRRTRGAGAGVREPAAS